MLSLDNPISVWCQTSEIDKWPQREWESAVGREHVIGDRDECSLSSFAQSSLYLFCVTLYTCFIRWVCIAMAIPLDALWSSCIHALSSYSRLSLRCKVASVGLLFSTTKFYSSTISSASVIWPIYASITFCDMSFSASECCRTHCFRYGLIVASEKNKQNNKRISYTKYLHLISALPFKHCREIRRMIYKSAYFSETNKKRLQTTILTVEIQGAPISFGFFLIFSTKSMFPNSKARKTKHQHN